MFEDDEPIHNLTLVKPYFKRRKKIRINGVINKFCSGCKTYKDILSFGVTKTPMGKAHQSRCKDCKRVGK